MDITEYLELPDARIRAVGVATKKVQLASLIADAVGYNNIAQAVFLHQDIIRGGSRSGRLLLHRPYGDSIPCERPMSSADMAAHAYSQYAEQEFRYDPSALPGHTKGWRVECIDFDSHTVVALWTEWVPNRADVRPK
jgi:hypothetical protein